MNVSLAEAFTALGLLISAITGIYVAVTTARNKKASSDDIYSQVEARMRDDYEKMHARNLKQYEILLTQKDRTIENHDIRISLLEQQIVTEREEKRVLLDYITYLLEGIQADKFATFRPVDIKTFRKAQEAGQF